MKQRGKEKNLSRKKIREFWDKLFPLREGQKVVLLKDTTFVTYGQQDEVRTIKKGTIGIVQEYKEGHPLIRVDFGIPKCSHLLEVKRVKRI